MDLYLKILAFICFAVFLAVPAFYVPSPSLVVVLVVVAAMAGYDFFVRPIRARNGRGS